MKLDEVKDPTMKFRFELAKLRADFEDQQQNSKKMQLQILALQRTVGALIKKLGPQD